MNRRALLLISITSSLFAQVSFDRIMRADKEPQNWLTYSGSAQSQRYSTLTQITPDNVKNLELQWVYQARSLEKFEATALVVDGVLYTVQAPNDVMALDAATGRLFWTTRTLRRPNHVPAAAASIAGWRSWETRCLWALSTRTWWQSMPRMASRFGTRLWPRPNPVMR